MGQHEHDVKSLPQETRNYKIYQTHNESLYT